ncbi:MAG: hypothetical protein HQK83_08725 [Fibrobacteria bacterium]|nr:hypothetical protein [Fibrobacteria bacterium]
MKKQHFFLMIALLFIGVNAKSPVDLIGIIEVSEEDENLQPVEISLMVDSVVGNTLNTTYYLIDLSSGKGRELLQKPEEKVRVTGTMRIDKQGDKRLIVKQYDLVLPVKVKDTEMEADTMNMDSDEYPLVDEDYNDGTDTED